MALITLNNLPSNGQLADATPVTAAFNTIANDYNGNITNDNIAGGAAIVDTKLAQIATASKVSGASFTALASITSAAGIIPNANIAGISASTITSGLLGTARLGSGTASSVTFLRGDQNWAVSSGLSNVVFNYALGGDGDTNNANGIILGTGLTDSNTSIKPAYWGAYSGASTLRTIIVSKFVKLASATSVTVWANMWQTAPSGSGQAKLQVLIGSATNTVLGTANQVTPEWKSMAIDVSSLTNDTTYDVSIKLTNTTNNPAYLNSIIGLTS